MIQSIQRTQRQGFTLVELLIAMAIIGTLAAITLLAVGRTRESEELRNSSMTLQVIDGILQQQLKVVVDKAKRDPVPNGTTARSSLNGGFGPKTIAESQTVSYLTDAAGDQDKARAQYIADIVRIEFPEKSTDSSKQPFASMASSSDNAQFLLGTTGLARGGAGMVSREEQLGYAIQENKWFVDSWGTPIRFRRSLTASTGGDFASVLSDLQDEARAFPAVGGKTVGATGKPSFNSLDPLGKLTGSEDELHKFGMFVYSAGPDKSYGTADDILSFRMRKTGQRGN
jgi:prepilin-type N-terminal cleavage/methylation domain-containing protein